ncbi:hypothetical protein ACVXG8_08765 [Escherichia coli]
MHTCNVRGFLSPATNATRDKAPQHCASPEPFRLAADSTIAFYRQHPAIFLIA